MLRTHAMTASGSGIAGIARYRGPRFSSDTTAAVCCVYLVGWRASVTGGSWICTLCDLLDRSDFVTWSSLMTSSVSNDDVTAAAGESLVSGRSGDVGLGSSPDISSQRVTLSDHTHATAALIWHNDNLLQVASTLNKSSLKHHACTYSVRLLYVLQVHNQDDDEHCTGRHLLRYRLQLSNNVIF